MKVYGAALAGLALALAGCGSDEGAPPAAKPSEAGPEQAAMPVAGPERRILAFGDSLLTGHGLKDGESYPARLEAALRARGVNARMSNAGVSGNTSADGLQRLAFTLGSQTSPPELVLISLGGNDMLRGLPPRQTRDNLDAILTELGKRKIPVILMGMLAPPNLGAEYRKSFDGIYPALAGKHDAALVPFFLQGVVGKADLIQPDRVHPTAAGIEAIVADTVDDVAQALPPVSPEGVAPPRR
jgi:acyl-CoA thioesterase-1